MTFRSLLTAVSILAFHAVHCSGHGFMQSPRSRNYVAYQDGVYSPLVEGNPEKEDCPHCLNLGGTLARCGMTADRNYDSPQNALGGPFTPTIREATFQQDEEVVIDVVLTAHHMGHFVYKACSISEGEVATQDCFDQNPLEFVEDVLYGAPKDTNYPERAYIAPTSHKHAIEDNSAGIYGMKFSHKFRLPQGLTGDLVLLQWHYLTANSCMFPGYDTYPFPDSSWANLGLGLCENIPEDGKGVPEQFWNCAEISIASDGSSTAPKPTSPPTTPVPAAPTSKPSASPTSTPAPPTSPSELCCPAGYTGLRAHDGCTKFYHCVDGNVVGSPIDCQAGLLFDQDQQVCNWENMVNCAPTNGCDRRMLRGN